ncbi:MAG TPA: pyrimidine reductase family protein [Acidimicrobiales bacterium]
MRRLLPDPTDDVDLDEAYALPGPGRLHVRANFVSSVDGAAEVGGRSGGLSSDADHRLFSVLRGLCDVVLVGAGTVRHERYGPARPSTERRAWRQQHGLTAVPPLAVVTSRIDLDLESAFFTEATTRPVILTTGAAPVERHLRAAEVAEVVVCGDTEVDLGTALEALVERGLTRVLCEGGPHMLDQLVTAGRLDELCLSLSPVIAGPERLRIIGGPPLDAPARLELGHVLAAEGMLFLRYTSAVPPGERRSVV